MKTMIYLDYAASTPVDPEVEKAMRPYFNKIFGNPGSTHIFGQKASMAVFEARQKIAKALGASYEEIIFTGSATEANNLALKGIAKKGDRIVVSAIEHESVLEVAKDLEKDGVEVVYVPVNREGIIDLKKLESAINKRTVLVSIQYVNSEIGTIQPIKEIAKIIFTPSQGVKIIFHVDAVQAFQFLKCDVNELGVDLLTLSAHKLYGPKGIGVLYARSGVKLKPLVAGGGQEGGFRSGTENVPAIVGFGKAVEITEKLRVKERKRIKSLRDYFWKELKKIVPGAELNGSPTPSRIPNNLNVYFPGRPAGDLCLELDMKGLSVSSGTACAARAARPSPVISALGYTNSDRPFSSLRFSLGRYTTKKEINQALTILKNRFKIA